MNANDGGPAFPVPVATPFGDGWLATGGMTLRDWFAGKALAGMLADPNSTTSKEMYAIASYALADAMLKAREAQP